MTENGSATQAAEWLAKLRRKQEQRRLHWQKRAAAARLEKKARRFLAITGHRTPEQLARECLAAAYNNRDQAIAIAGKRVRGAKLRATVAAICSALLRASTP